LGPFLKTLYTFSLSPEHLLSSPLTYTLGTLRGSLTLTHDEDTQSLLLIDTSLTDVYTSLPSHLVNRTGGLLVVDMSSKVAPGREREYLEGVKVVSKDHRVVRLDQNETTLIAQLLRYEGAAAGKWVRGVEVGKETQVVMVDTDTVFQGLSKEVEKQMTEIEEVMSKKKWNVVIID
jgi:hypothetical protein